MIRIVLADDHHLVRRAIGLLLSDQGHALTVVGEASDGHEALRLAGRHQPDVLVADLMMPGMGGLELTRRLPSVSPTTNVVILSMHADIGYVAEAVRAGACGYVLKDAPAADLAAAVQAAAASTRFLSAPLSKEALADYLARAEPSDPLSLLSNRERDVFQLTAEGLTATEAGERLHISPRTVESHRASLMRKLGLTSQAEVIRFAHRKQLIK